MTSTWNEIPAGTPQDIGSPSMSVYVVSVRREFLRAALTTARQLTDGLGAQLVVLVPQVVPYPLDLSHPPVARDFLEQKLLSDNEELPCVENARILLCRDEEDAILSALAPKSTVVLGAKKRFWRTREQALAVKLRRDGHQVVLAFA